MLMPLPVTPRMTPVPAETVWTMELLNSTPVDTKEIQPGTRSDSTLSKVMKFVQYGWPPSNIDEALKPYSGFSLTRKCASRTHCLAEKWKRDTKQQGERVLSDAHGLGW